MYRIPGIVSLIQKNKKHLSSDDVVTIGCQIWKNKDNPALLKCVCPDKDPNYVFDPYNPDLPLKIKRKYKRSKEIQHDKLSDDENFIDLESGPSNQYYQDAQMKDNNYHKTEDSFWSDVANVVLGTDNVKIEDKRQYDGYYNDVQRYPHKQMPEIKVEYNRNQYIEPYHHQHASTYNDYGAQLNSIDIV